MSLLWSAYLAITTAQIIQLRITPATNPPVNRPVNATMSFLSGEHMALFKDSIHTFQDDDTKNGQIFCENWRVYWTPLTVRMGGLADTVQRVSISMRVLAVILPSSSE